MNQIPAGASDDAIEAHLQLAMEQVAMHAVKLAVARWTIGDTIADPLPASTQSRWYAEAHGNFTAWLSAGGFAQADPEPVFGEDALLDDGADCSNVQPQLQPEAGAEPRHCPAPCDGASHCPA